MFHSFVDESKDPAYLLVAAFVRPNDIHETRQAITAMVMPNQRRIHFHRERDDRKAQIMARLCDMHIEAIIYKASGKAHDKINRDMCLKLLIRDHMRRDVRRLVLERDDSNVDVDCRLLLAEIRGVASSDFRFDHMRAHEEPLLSIPDAIAWCWSRGGHWRVKAKGLVTDVLQA